ncbi:hypothetical protein QOZ92_000580 [Paeniclostridium ghonii]|uniref:Uncharacterized protein n=1 Tax=Paraclostridium ghonii TaxID=29358 RepID=A0ABU0MX32_9FIRM|nr:hypothetical protein [Paeniclostridium ghonii]MDQ0555467.1 hypothetical protein [Paeniclostridium ghonii]
MIEAIKASIISRIVSARPPTCILVSKKLSIKNSNISHNPVIDILKQKTNKIISFLLNIVFELELRILNKSYANNTNKTPDRKCIISS